MVSGVDVGMGIAAAMWPRPVGAVPARKSWLKASAHSATSARVSTLRPPGSCTTTDVCDSTGMRNSSRLCCWTATAALSCGSRDPMPPPPDPLVSDGRFIETATVPAIQPSTMNQRPDTTTAR